MNRQILFRGKRSMGGDWVEGSLLVEYNGNCHILSSIKGECKAIHYNNVIRDTVGQYTGHLDKNGKKIYEGDIIQMNNEIYTNLLICEWDAFLASFYYVDLVDQMKTYYISKRDFLNAEIVSNIYDNKL